MGERQRVRPPGGHPDHGEAIDRERVNELPDVGGERQQRAAWGRVRSADPRTTDGDVADTEVVSDRLQIDRAAQGRADRAVAVDDGPSVAPAGPDEGQAPAVGEAGPG